MSALTRVLASSGVICLCRNLTSALPVDRGKSSNDWGNESNGAWIPSHNGARPVPFESTGLAEYVSRRDREVERQLRGQVHVRQATDSVRAEQTAHQEISACCTEEPCGPSSDQ